MRFERTVESVFQSIDEVTITHEDQLADQLRRYERQLEQPNALPDRGLIEQAYTLLQERLLTTPLDSELLYFVLWIDNHEGAFEESILLMRRFLASSSHSFDEQAWARWHLVDNLALARHCSETVYEQEQLLRFALQHFSAADSLFVLSDGTQASCWERTGQGAQWLALLENLLGQVEPSSTHRSDRFYCLRTAAYVCISLQANEQAYLYARSIRTLADEDAHWADNLRYQTDAAILEMKIVQETSDVVGMRRIGQTISDLLATHKPDAQTAPIEQIRCYRMLCHNTAAPLYRAKQYDLAIPLFRQAIVYGAMPYDPYLWLAASLWSTTQCKDETLSLLRQAAQRYSDGGAPWQQFQRLPEFYVVRDDPEFQQASRVVREK